MSDRRFRVFKVSDGGASDWWVAVNVIDVMHLIVEHYNDGVATVGPESEELTIEPEPGDRVLTMHMDAGGRSMTAAEWCKENGRGHLGCTEW